MTRFIPTHSFAFSVLSALLLSTAFVVQANQTTSYSYNSLGLVATMDGPRTDVSDITSFGYDAAGNRTQMTNALGHVTQITSYDLSGRPLVIIDPNGAQTTLTYDARGRLLSQNTAGRLVTFSYDATGNVILISQSNGQALTYTYDSAHRPTGYSDNFGNQIIYTLDAAGNQIKEDIYDPASQLSRTHQFIFDELSRLRNDIGADNQTANLDYDTNNNLTNQTDPKGNPTQFAFDGLNRLIDSTDADNGSTAYGYDDRDNLTSVTDPKGLTTTYSYDAFDNLIQQDSPDTGITSFTYDDANNRVSQTDANGVTSTYSYDALNRLTTISYPDSSLNVTYTYDENSNNQNGIGRLTSQTDASGTTSYAYDLRGNVISMANTRGAYTLTTLYSYNTSDQLIQMTYPDGRTVEYQYDLAGRLSQMTTTDNQNVTTTILSNMTYQPFGPMTSQTFGNGLITGSSIDLDYRQTQLSTPNVLDRFYNFDLNSNISQITDNVTSNAQVFNYDNLDRLDDANDSDTNYGLIDYGYDATHNRTSKDTLLNALTDNESYLYDANSHHLASKTAGTVINYQYDANGNMLDNGSYQFGYGDDNRLHTVSNAGQVVATYTYNAQGQRTQKTTTIDTTYYLYGQQGELLAEVDAAGQLSKGYLFANGQLSAIAQSDSTTSPSVEILLDNDDASFSDNWPLSTAIAGFIGTNYQYHAGGSSGPGVLGAPIDNLQASFIGTWSASSGDGLYAGLMLQVPNTLDVSLNATADPAALNAATGTLSDLGEFKANSHTHYIQQNAVTADLASGGFVVAWESYLHPGDNSSNGVYAQRYDAQGIAQGSEFQVNAYITKWQEHPSVTGLSNGDFVITWQSYQQEGSSNGHGVYSRRYDAQGVALSGEIHVNTYLPGDQRESQVTSLNDGGYIVTWHSDNQDGSGRGIYAQRYNAQGATTGTEFKINSTTASDQHEPSIASLNNGGFVATWHSAAQDSDGSTGIYGQRYDSAGVKEGAEFQINTQISNAQTDSSVASLTNGGFVVTWQSISQDNGYTGVYGQRYDAQGATEGGEFKANTHNTSNKIRPSIASLSNGGFIIAWDAEDQDSSDTSTGVYGQLYDSQGITDGSEFHINSYTTDLQRHNHLSSLGSGFIAGWTSEWQDGNRGGIYAKRYEIAPASVDNYTVQVGDTWASIATNVYGDVNAASALQTVMLNADLAVVATLNLPLSLDYTSTLTADSSVLSTTTPPYYTVLASQSWQDIALVVYGNGSQIAGDALSEQLSYINPYYGINYQQHAAGTGTNSVTWNTNVTTSGSYDIYATWVADTDRASNVKYIINHSSGSETITVDQQQNGSQWNLLGTYSLDLTSTVTLSDDANGIVVADGLTVVPAGTAPSSQNDTATWTPNLTGEYYLYANWTADTDRASDAKYTITHTSGNDAVNVNQQQNGGQWHLLGAYTLDNSSTIALSDNANGVVIADGIKLVSTTILPPTQTAGLYYVHNDHLGTPQTITDQNQAIAWQAVYNPFGEATIITSAIDNNVRFPGQYFDEETNLHYNYFRYYDPELGRYITSDPIGLAGGINTYGYVQGNPINWSDPDGLRPMTPDPNRRAAGIELRRTYFEMKDRNIVGSDQFFHCLAACRATKASGAPDIVRLMMDEKEDKDSILNNFGLYGDNGRLSDVDMLVDMNKDKAANEQGIQCPANIPCNKQCQPLIDAMTKHKSRTLMRNNYPPY